jgi:thiol:disulfide interchange protein DsbC
MSLLKHLTLLAAAAVALVTATLPSFAMSGGGCGGDCASCHSITVNEADSLLKGIGKVTAVKPAPVRGLYEVTFEQQGNTGVAYLDYGKKHIIAGQAYDIASMQPVGGNAPTAKQQERLDPTTLSSTDALVMGNPNGKKKLFVFTDPECPYCAKAHGEFKKLAALEPDLAIYIKLFPLKMHPKAYDKARVILAANSLELLEDSFAGKALPAAGETTPKKPVDETIHFAGAAGINSTPTLVLADGRIVPGFKDAAAMRQLLH